MTRAPAPKTKAKPRAKVKALTKSSGAKGVSKSLWAATASLVMGKGEAVAKAVAEQLTFENHWPPEDFNKVMGADYGYDVPTLGNLLYAVHNRLEADTPSYNFQFDVNFVKSSVSKTVAELTGAIYSKTI